jgi:hypothetical protein
MCPLKLSIPHEVCTEGEEYLRLLLVSKKGDAGGCVCCVGGCCCNGVGGCCCNGVGGCCCNGVGLVVIGGISIVVGLIRRNGKDKDRKRKRIKSFKMQRKREIERIARMRKCKN